MSIRESIENNIVIKDACILFDLIQLDLMDAFFELKLEVFTTQAVVEEVTDTNQSKIVQKHIELENILIDSFGNDDFIFSLAMKNRGLSLVDCSVIDLAIRKRGILLSSDQSLRKVSESKKVEVHGILWIIYNLVIESVISKEIGINKLIEYKKINQRAPGREINKMIKTIEVA